MAKNAPRNAKNGPAGLKSEPVCAKMGPAGALFGHFGCNFGQWEHSIWRFHAFLPGVREELCILPENQWKVLKNQENFTENYGLCTTRHKKVLKSGQKCTTERQKWPSWPQK